MNIQKSPLYTDSLALSRWLLDRLSNTAGPLASVICERALVLHTSLLLALEDRRRNYHLDRADEALIMLRSLLRLSVEIGTLDQRQLLHALGHTDSIERQLGNWRRALKGVSATESDSETLTIGNAAQ